MNVPLDGKQKRGTAISHPPSDIWGVVHTCTYIDGRTCRVGIPYGITYPSLRLGLPSNGKGE